jgi:hypothetical protein
MIYFKNKEVKLQDWKGTYIDKIILLFQRHYANKGVLDISGNEFEFPFRNLVPHPQNFKIKGKMTMI